jgi:hypothetical protein
VLRLGLGLRLCETGVVVGELVQVRQCDLPGRDLVVVADVRLSVAEALLELDFEAFAELREVKPRGSPVDADRLADRARLVL